VTPRMSTRVRLAVALLLLFTGTGVVVTWSAFAAMYVRECPTFSVFSPDARCSVPVMWILAGYALAALGILLLAIEALRALRRRGHQCGAGPSP
jgi:hypothetical protein